MKIWIAVYIIILLFLWRQYRKIKKNPEKYDDMEAIYQYEPRFRYLKPTELAWRNVADSYWRVNAIAIITLGCIILLKNHLFRKKVLVLFSILQIFCWSLVLAEQYLPMQYIAYLDIQSPLFCRCWHLYQRCQSRGRRAVQ